MSARYAKMFRVYLAALAAVTVLCLVGSLVSSYLSAETYKDMLDVMALCPADLPDREYRQCLYGIRLDVDLLSEARERQKVMGFHLMNTFIAMLMALIASALAYVVVRSLQKKTPG